MYEVRTTPTLSANTLTQVCSLELPMGKYIIVADVLFYENDNSFLSQIMIGNDVLVKDSGYDSGGYTATNCCTLVELTQTTTIILKTQCSKTAETRCTLRANNF